MNKRVIKQLRAKAQLNTLCGGLGDEEKEYNRLKLLYKSVKQGKDINLNTPIMNDTPKVFDSEIKDLGFSDEFPQWHVPKPFPGIKETEWMSYEEAQELENIKNQFDSQLVPDWIKEFVKK